jgi:4-diphosphocytidyl-2-C-methyl-D-erythritol kinase
MKAARLRARAYAKINLDLRVLGLRPDGYHELRTVFQTIDLFDTLTFVARRGPFALRCAAPGVPQGPENLVWVAAARLWSALGRPGEPRDVAVRLVKQVPPQAGLGGASSDAAAALLALGRLWAGRPPLALLRDVAASVGTDVPFFLSGGTALGLGRGEEIYPLVDLPPHWVTLVLPPFGVSTREAYGWYEEDRQAGYLESEPRDLQVLPIPWPTRAAQMVNDLERPVARRHPEIAQVRAALRTSGAVGAAMSGSGSAVFGLFRTRAAAAAAARRLRRPGWRVVVTRTLGRDDHERRARPVRVRR